ncbi:hypothetical protein Trydic_g15101 [Trypoxylus dichotomus]
MAVAVTVDRRTIRKGSGDEVLDDDDRRDDDDQTNESTENSCLSSIYTVHGQMQLSKRMTRRQRLVGCYDTRRNIKHQVFCFSLVCFLESPCK